MGFVNNVPAVDAVPEFANRAQDVLAAAVHNLVQTLFGQKIGNAVAMMQPDEWVTLGKYAAAGQLS